MKKKISLMLATLLLSCSFIFAQNGGIPVELKPFNPPNKPPFGNIVGPKDTFINNQPAFIIVNEIDFLCFQGLNYLTLSCNMDESVSVVIYEMLSGVKFS